MAMDQRNRCLVRTLMRSAALAAFLSAGAGAAIASAQDVSEPKPGSSSGETRQLSEAAIVKRVRADGYKDISTPVNNGNVFTMEATDRHGMRVQLTVDAVLGFVRGGQIIGRAPSSAVAAPPSRESERITPAPVDAAAARTPELPIVGTSASSAKAADRARSAKARAALNARQARLARERAAAQAAARPPVLTVSTTSSARRHYFLPLGD